MESYHTGLPFGKPPHAVYPQYSPVFPRIALPHALLRTQSAEASGLYALIARRWLTTFAPVELSTTDLARWVSGRAGPLAPGDPLRLRILTRIRHLVDAGWLVASGARGTTRMYTPTWGCRRDGTPIPWDAGQAQYGRRGQFVALPAQLIDAAFGRYHAATRTVEHALHRPLLDLADIGTYARAQIATSIPTPRLAHLGLLSTTESASLAPLAVLRQLAADGVLTTLDADGQIVPVDLSIAGRVVFFGRAGDQGTDQGTDQHMHRDTDRSLPQQDAVPSDSSHATFFHEDHDPMKESNQDQESPPIMCMGGGSQQHANHETPRIADDVLHNHQVLNPFRRVGRGELAELADLFAAHGNMLLTWQERALRSTLARPDGIHPGYYRHCAADAALARTPRSSGERRAHRRAAAARCVPTTADAPPTPTLDAGQRAAIAVLEAALGEPIRRPQQLADAEPAQIRAWAQVAGHAGMRRWNDPVGWIVRAIARGNQPPATTTLDRWAQALPTDPTYWQRAAAAQRGSNTASAGCSSADAIPPACDEHDAPTLLALLAEALPANVAAAVALLDIVADDAGVIMRPHGALEHALARDIAGVVTDVLCDAGLPAAVRIVTVREEPDARGTPCHVPGSTTAAPPLPRACVPPPPADARPAAVPEALWATLSMVARAAVRVGNWHALARLAGIDVARQCAPADWGAPPRIAHRNAVHPGCVRAQSSDCGVQ